MRHYYMVPHVSFTPWNILLGCEIFEGERGIKAAVDTNIGAC